ncbi:DUF3265 domain-containing protein [Vibrio metschnikovii]|nr:DUF3265 domain-containing protein [Vibrio metschnikovii]
MKFKHNKRFKRDNQRVAFLLCVYFCGYSVMRKLGSGVGCPLTGRYAPKIGLTSILLCKIRTTLICWLPVC